MVRVAPEEVAKSIVSNSRTPPWARRPPAVMSSPPEYVEVAVEYESIPSPETVRPCVALRAFAINPPENDEVPVTPVILSPPAVISTPPAKDEVAVPVTAKFVVVARVARRLVMVVEEKNESIVLASNDPPVMVSPLVDEIPVVVTPCNVEEAVVDVAWKLFA